MTKLNRPCIGREGIQSPIRNFAIGGVGDGQVKLIGAKDWTFQSGHEGKKRTLIGISQSIKDVQSRDEVQKGKVGNYILGRLN